MQDRTARTHNNSKSSFPDFFVHPEDFQEPFDIGAAGKLTSSISAIAQWVRAERYYEIPKQTVLYFRKSGPGTEQNKCPRSAKTASGTKQT